MCYLVGFGLMVLSVLIEGVGLTLYSFVPVTTIAVPTFGTGLWLWLKK